MILIDTSALIDGLTGPRRSGPKLYSLVERGARMVLPSLVLFEWLRGPRTEAELAVQESLFPGEAAIAFSTPDARLSAKLYRELRRPKGREIDIAIAACAINLAAELWTLNTADFADIPGLKMLGS